jgi:hypothetical protein
VNDLPAPIAELPFLTFDSDDDVAGLAAAFGFALCGAVLPREVGLDQARVVDGLIAAAERESDNAITSR